MPKRRNISHILELNKSEPFAPLVGKKRRETISNYLNGEVKLMMASSKIICYLSGSFQIRRTLNIRKWKRST